MKQIVLAKRSSRIFAGLIDLVILLLTSILTFLFVVYPLTFDGETYIANEKAMSKMYGESGLYFANKEGSYHGKSNYYEYFDNVDKLSAVNMKIEGELIKDINLSKDLYIFYTQKYVDYDATVNLSDEVYLTDVLKVNTPESNIKSCDLTTFKITPIDEKQESKTIEFFLETYKNAALKVSNATKVKTLRTQNVKIMTNSLLLIFPVLIGYGLIFNLIIPLCAKENQTIGKYIFNLGVLDQYGYKLKKWKLIPRFIIYLGVEVILGIATFGGVFLISYTMFMFAKKRRCMHDMVAGSVVVDLKHTIYFNTREEEEYYKKKEGSYE